MSAMSLYSQPMSLRVNSSASERALFAVNTYVPVNLNGGGINVYISTDYIFLEMPFLVRQCIVNGVLRFCRAVESAWRNWAMCELRLSPLYARAQV